MFGKNKTQPTKPFLKNQLAEILKLSPDFSFTNNNINKKIKIIL